jgi:hypothetical protein
MIKTTGMISAHTIHVLHVAVRDFFIVLLVLCAALFFWLIHGIAIDTLTFGNYKIERLYIKLDKKLTLRVGHVKIPQSKAKPSFENLDKTFDRIQHVLTYFDQIDLKRVDFKNNRYTIFYTDDVLYITNDTYEIAGNIERRGRKLIADVSMLRLKDFNTTLSGKLSYDLDTHTLETGGVFETFGIDGNFRALKQKKELVYAANSKPFVHLRPLIKRIGMPKAIESWVIDKVKAREYRLVYLKGKLPLDESSIVRKIATMKAKAHFKDVTITFNPKVDPVHAKEMTLTYKKGNLYFDLKDATYKGRSVDGSTVVIKHIIGPQTPVLTLNLHVNGPLDMEVHRIFKAYGLYIPLWHSGEKDKTKITLKIPLVKHGGKIKTKVDVVLDKGKADIAGFPCYLKGGEVYYAEGKAILKNIEVSEPWFTGRVDGKLDTRLKSASLMLDAKHALLGKENAPLMELKDKKIPLQLSYANPLKIQVPSLGIKVIKEKNAVTINLTQMKKIVPYIKHNILGIKGGTLTITTNDLETFHFSGNLKKDICFFYEKEDMCYTMIPVDGNVNIKTEAIQAEAFGKRLKFDSKRSIVKLVNLNIDLKKFIEEQKRLHERSPRSVIGKKKLTIVGENSELRYNEYRLVTDSYTIKVKPNGDINAVGTNDGDVVTFIKKGHNFFIEARRIKDRMLHPLIHFNGLKGGRYSLKKEGDPSKKMKGHILIEGGVLSHFKAYSNTLAFINTIPALATLNSPGFSNQGFKIEKGVIDYTMTPKEIIFDSVYLKGNTATIIGKGTVSLTGKREINVDLAIQSVREFGNMVGKIPLLGYILMGDDNSMTVGLKITGTLDDPKVNTSIAKDILTLPLRILKRTITAPAHLGTHKQVAPNIPDANKKTLPSQKQQVSKVPKPKKGQPKNEPHEKSVPKRTLIPSVNRQTTRSEAPSKDPSGQLF